MYPVEAAEDLHNARFTFIIPIRRFRRAVLAASLFILLQVQTTRELMPCSSFHCRCFPSWISAEVGIIICVADFDHPHTLPSVHKVAAAADSRSILVGRIFLK